MGAVELSSAVERSVVIGVIDSGWDNAAHDRRVLSGVGLVDPHNDFGIRYSDDDQDRIGHGTACIDIVLRGSPESRIVPIRVFGSRLETSVSTLIAAIDWAVEERLRIVNVSLGTVREDAVVPLYAACERARMRGVIIVAACGTGSGRTYPAAFENAIGVGAEGLMAPGGICYRQGASVECAASGRHSSVLSLGGRRVTVQGASFAAPVVSAKIARIIEHNPGASLDCVRSLLGSLTSVD